MLMLLIRAFAIGMIMINTISNDIMIMKKNDKKCNKEKTKIVNNNNE